MAKITKIESTVPTIAMRKVAAYARVSTDSEEQQTSYDAQVDHYENYIKSREDWEFVSVYTDSGISGTSTKRREGFNQMITDALDGKISLIVTKSVSRFARNTVDSLTNIRKLKAKGVECYCEKENIWTFDGKGELLLTIMSSLAQAESRSISQNCTWGQRKRFADGKVTVPFSRFLGYDRGDDGNLVVNEKEAEIVKKIYALFLQGHTPYGISKLLTEEGILSPSGKSNWATGTVGAILKNEKYKGDALLQKSYTVDFLTKKTKVNEGEIPQYYVEGNHEAIITPEIFEIVQQEFEQRKKGKKQHSGVHYLSGKVKCGNCGHWYGSKTWHSNSKYKRVVWQCNHKFQEKKCKSPHFSEGELQSKILIAVNKLIDLKEDIAGEMVELISATLQTDKLEEERGKAHDELVVTSDLMEQAIRENAQCSFNQLEYQNKYNELEKRFNKAEKKHKTLTEEINNKKSQQIIIEKFLDL
ncbi:MAG: recombinase family protein [Eubacteriales bacterium]